MITQIKRKNDIREETTMISKILMKVEDWLDDDQGRA
jgi:hypothetical protein